ncbi:AAA family ATPase [Nocardioides sp. SR21]|uniref:AAA family ATPase n=1 Tax=Nocardioides sp. SR21 TaxID=2919501 RepID=UPI001FAA0CB2|nr:LuxR family transcriptional regulator [Nocardioides sp. SR21]
MSTATVAAPLVGRDGELELIQALLADGRQALVLEGVPGVGKTSLWEHGVAQGRDRGMRVLVARASGAETGLPGGALIDLMDGVTSADLAALPAPQRRALEVALYRQEPAGRPPEPGAIALGLLNALRALGADQRVLVAIDDVQWLDPASEEALAYAARRLDPAAVTCLLARRPGERSALEEAFGDGMLHRREVGPLSLGATRQVLSGRLGVRLPHHMLRRIYDATLGNPLFVLEVGRQLAGRDVATFGEDIPVPDDVEDLLGLRVADLDGPARRVLLALALDPDLKPPHLDGVAGPDAVATAVREGVAVLDGERVRPSHPLLAAAAKRQAPEEVCRDLHRELAAVVPDEQRQALHLALATTTADEGLAARLTAAADRAAARGAPRLAVELGTHALRLTSPESEAHVDRLLALGRALAVAAERPRLTALLQEAAATLPTPADRVTAYLLLTSGVVRDNEHLRSVLERALAEAAGDPALRAPVLAELAENEGVIRVVALPSADRYAVEALESAANAEDRRSALYALSWTRALRGQPIDDVAAEHRALSDEHAYLARDPARVAGQRFVWRGEVTQGRDVLAAQRQQADDWAEPSSYALARLHLCELELRVGGHAEAQRMLDEWGASSDSRLLLWPMYERCRALLAAGRGDADEARRWGDHARELADETGVRWDWLEATRALGLAALLDKDHDTAVAHLSAVWEHTEREGIADPGAFPVAVDLVEALVDAGDLDTARAVTARLDELGRAASHPWALVGAQRCSAYLRLAHEYDDGSAGALAECAAAYAELGLPPDEARTLLTLGRVQRRARKWGAARESLERSAEVFEQVGAPGWVGEARAELERVGARRPSEGRLTATEQRVAELAVEGLSNKEIARTLVVTVSTVEFHLRNVYAKLGVRSRVQLAGGALDDPVPGS